MAIEKTFPLKTELPSNVAIPFIKGRILIDGKLIDSGFEFKKVYSPCSLRNEDGSVYYPEIGLTPKVSGEVFLQAVESCHKAWDHGRGDWPTARMEERINAVQAFRDKMKECRETIVRLLMWEIAKTRADAENEFDRTILYIDDTIEATKGLDRDSSRIQFASGIMAQTRRAPLGVTLCMGPFNYPLNETFTTLIPALIMGNVVVAKIPRYGQLIWDVLLEAFKESFPPGVINIVNGEGRSIVNPAVQKGLIDVLAFIGSSGVANKIKLSHPRAHRFRSILGLDAKNPGLILPDADLENAVNECVKGSLSFNGQRCTALKVLFVHKSQTKRFYEAFTEKVNSLKYGLPWEDKVFITPLPDQQKPQQLKDMVKEAISLGATLCNEGRGGEILESIFFPAVLKNVSLESRLAREEQFGPVVPIIEYEKEEEFIDYVVHSDYGMQASIFGNDSSTVGALIDQLSNQVCRINLNSQCQRGPDIFPFTGRKSSAEGTLSVFDALRSFSIRAMVATKQDHQGKELVKHILEKDSSKFLSTNIVL